MQRNTVASKWRPPLALVLGGSLLAVLILPVLGLFVVDALSGSMGRAQAVFTVALGALSATLILGWLLWRLILGPVRALSKRAEAIRGGQSTVPLARYGTPEISDLGETVLEMAEVLRARELQVRSYTDHVTHELKTPLTAIRGAAELLEADTELSAGNAKLVATIQEAETRAEKLLAAARDIAAARSPDHHGVSTLNEVSSAFIADGVQCEGGDVILPLAAEGLSVVVSHLVQNAKSAGASKIKIVATETETGPKLAVTDDGPGISKGNKDKIFEPFFTTRRDSGGTGMGLAIVQTLLLAHGARITLDNSDSGTSFTVSF